MGQKNATFDEIKACKCCYNCANWAVDYGLEHTYTYNACDKNDMGKPIMSSMGFCCTAFIKKEGLDLKPNVFGHGEQRG